MRRQERQCTRSSPFIADARAAIAGLEAVDKRELLDNSAWLSQPIFDQITGPQFAARLQSARRAVADNLAILDNATALQSAIERAESIDPAGWAINPNTRRGILHRLWLVTQSSRVDPSAGTDFRQEFEEMERAGLLKIKSQSQSITMLPGVMGGGPSRSYRARTR